MNALPGVTNIDYFEIAHETTQHWYTKDAIYPLVAMWKVS